MTDTSPAEAPAPPERMPARSDLRDAVGWMVLGLATLIASIRMDRLEHQHINPLTVPGLLPGLLGLAMITLGLVLAVRSWRRGAFAQAAIAPDSSALQRRKRVALTIALSVGYTVVLVGRGLPFWLASSVYVTSSILIFEWIGSHPGRRRLSARTVIQAIVIGVASSVIIWLVFERLFLVRMP